jgi:hypothetical protein
MTWLYEDNIFDDPTGYYGFVYEITNNLNGKKYIGRKYFTMSKTRQVKGKKKRSRVENDWRDYWGSSKYVQEDIEKLGVDNFTRRIIRLCKTRGECNYWEAKLQFENNVLQSKLDNGENAYYNENILVKFTRKNIGK